MITTVYSIDTRTHNQEICVEIHESSFRPETLVVLTDSTQVPYHRIYLTPDEARTLAEFLYDQAAAAEDRDV